MSLTKVNTRMIDGAVLSLLDFGADPTGSSDSSTAMKNALESGAEFISVPAGTYSENSGPSTTTTVSKSRRCGTGSRTARSRTSEKRT